MRKLISILLLICVALPAVAEEAQLGRLFTTPAERAKIDQDRASTSDIATLNGYVINSQGKTTTWINSISEQAPGKLQVLQRAGQAPVISVETATGARVKVRVGDTVDLLNNQVQTLIDAPQYVAPGKAK